MKNPLLTLAYVLLAALGFCDVARSQDIRLQRPNRTPSEPPVRFVRVASGTKLIHYDRRTIQLLVADRSVHLDYYTDLLIATMNDEKTAPEKLVGETIALVRDQNRKDQWNALLGVGAGASSDALVLAGNIFRVHKVFAATGKNKVKIQIDGETHQLQPGQVVMVLG
jgi:hypothetical protein